MEDTALKREPVQVLETSSNLANIASGPIPSTSSCRSESSSSAISAGASLVATGSGSTSFQQPLSTAQEGRLNTSGDRTSICIVHDRRWVPTYQFTLTRCYQALNLETKYGRAFSRFVCCCESSVPGKIGISCCQSQDKRTIRIYSLYPATTKWRGVYWNCHGCPSICLWTQVCRDLFSYSFARTALKFIHNVCVYMKLCMCNFHDHTIIGCGIIFP